MTKTEVLHSKRGNTRIYSLSSCPHITYFRYLLLFTGTHSLNFCFDLSEGLQQANGNNKVTLQIILVFYIF